MVVHPPLSAMSQDSLSQQLANIKLQGQQLVKNPQEVIRILNIVLDSARGDAYPQPTKLTKDNNASAVANAMSIAIIRMYNNREIPRIEIPKDPIAFKQVMDAIKTDSNVLDSLKTPGRIVPGGTRVAESVPSRIIAQKYGISFQAGNMAYEYTISSKDPVPSNPFALRVWLQNAANNIISISVKGETPKTKSSIEFNDRIQALSNNLDRANKERNKVTVLMK